MKKPPSFLKLIAAASVMAAGTVSIHAQDINKDFSKGVTFLQDGNSQAAYETFDAIIRAHSGKANEIGPVFGSIYFHRGVAAMRKQDWEKAASDFTTCFSQFKNVADANKSKNMYQTMAMYQAAVCQRMSGQYAEALKNFEAFEKRAGDKNIPDRQTVAFNRGDLKAHMAFCYASEGKPKLAAAALHDNYTDDGKRDPKTGSQFKANPMLNEQSLIATLKAFLDTEDSEGGIEFIRENRQYINRDAGLRYQFAQSMGALGAVANQAGDYGYAMALLSIVPMTDESLEWLRQAKGGVEAMDRPGGVKSPLGKQIEAIEAKIAKDVAEGNPIEVLVLETMGAIYEANRNFEGSYAVFEELLAKFPKAERRSFLLYRAANAAYVTGRVNECQKYADAFIQEFPDHELRDRVENMRILGIFLNGQYERALTVLETAIIPEGSDLEDMAMYVRGASNYFLGNWNEAATVLGDHVNKYRESESQYVESTMFFLADTQARLGDFRKAGAMLDKYLEKYPEGQLLDRALYSRAMAHFYLDETDAAQKRLNDFFSQAPDSLVRDEAYKLFGDVIYSSENPDVESARKQYQRALETAQEFAHDNVAADALQSLLILSNDEQEWDKSVEIYETYFEKYPEGFNRAKIAVNGLKPLEEVGRLDEGLEKVAELIVDLGSQRDAFGVEDLITAYSQTAVKGGMELEELRDKLLNLPVSGSAEVTRAMLLMAVIDAYEDAIKQEKDEARKRLLAGTVSALYRQMEDRFAPDRLSNYILIRVGQQLVDRGRSAEAEKYLKEILVRDDTAYQTDARYALAELNMKQGGAGDLDESVQILRDLLDNNPNEKAASREKWTVLLGNALMKAEKWKEAEAVWDGYLKEGWRSFVIEATFKMGVSRQESGDDGGAQACYTNVVASDPGYLEYSLPSWKRMADIFRDNGRNQDAYDTLHNMISRVGHLEEKDEQGIIRDARVTMEALAAGGGVVEKPLPAE
ncbi:tetratricopeptide repeat protein [Sulfuriroseicoccus oceanibius]|uniref:Tetratricopeptide repeat protein n=1 Tax=Sulfuriroseicoccus oceanibius TaxID=2707525 RepID=A0A6B3L7S8_9BACT|nr:tetratricopeptide repeat protein [Sulfuriroseicoccus oceanibius]QQL44207.1 tetratricopeptide repeat protein [Sulfuriroseicoccus oceanibius]